MSCGVLYRTGAPWRDLPERFGKWNTIYKVFDRWAKAGVWAKVLEQVQRQVHATGDLDWVASIDSTVVRVHQHGATLPRLKKGPVDLQEIRGGAAGSRDRPLPRGSDNQVPPGM